MRSFLLVMLCLIILSSCALPMPSVGPGYILTTTKEGLSANNNVPITKSGEACATNILGILSFGDSGIEAAKKSADIKEVATVDREYFSVLGIFAEACTVVAGS